MNPASRLFAGLSQKSKTPQYVYLCGVQPLPVKALTTFVIGDLKYQIGQIKPRDLR